MKDFLLKDFLLTFNEMLKELESDGKVKEDTIHKMAREYKKLSPDEKDRSLQIICEILNDQFALKIYFLSDLLVLLQDQRIIKMIVFEFQKLSELEWEKKLKAVDEILNGNISVKIYILSALLKLTGKKYILDYISKAFCSKSYPLWEKINDIKLFHRYLFLNDGFYKENDEYRKYNDLYEFVLSEIQSEIKDTLPYIPYSKRSKSIVIVVSQLWTKNHAPTRYVRCIYNYLKNMGYQVKCVICFLAGDGGYWYGKSIYYNIKKDSGSYEYDLEGVKVEGYNFTLHAEEFIEELKEAVRYLWDNRPEFILEVGSQTILAGLCCDFTTIVSMNCTKDLPITNAPLIAVLDTDSKEQRAHNQIVKADQRIIEVTCNIQDIYEDYQLGAITRKDFGLLPEDFVILIAGNRLDDEINNSFLKVLEQILEMDERFAIVLIGSCPQLKRQIRKERIYFWGSQENFRGAISLGDVFLNPPRQGGGTGGLFAILEGVPVITLDDCDVQISVGEDFVCSNIEEMPKLIYRYYSDPDFMEQQKRNCRKRAKILTGIDSKKSFQRLCKAVKEYAEDKEYDSLS